jgi:ubiquinone biosynthesis accessory factor UbiJ
LNALHSWQKSALVNVAQNFREYLTEESLQLIPQREIEAFFYDVNNLRDDLERLDKRISRL